MDLDWFLAEQEARHVEIVDHHVAEQAAGARNIADRRRPRVARQNGDEFDIADLALRDPRLQGAEMQIETPVEADHQRRAGLVHDIEAGPDAVRGKVDRLFAEDRLAGPSSLLDEIRVGIGRRADEDRLDIAVGHDGLDRGDGDASS